MKRSIRGGRVVRQGRGSETDGIVTEIWWTEKGQVKRVMLRNRQDGGEVSRLLQDKLGVSDGGGKAVQQLKYAGQALREAGDQLGAAEACLLEAGNEKGSLVVRAALEMLRKEFALDGGMCHGGGKTGASEKTAEARQ